MDRIYSSRVRIAYHFLAQVQKVRGAYPTALFRWMTIQKIALITAP